MSDIEAQKRQKAEPTRIRPIILAITAAFGLFYAFAVWAAVGNAIRYANGYSKFDLSAPVWLFAITILVPIIVFGLAFLCGRRRTVLELSIVLFAGFAVVCALSLGLTALNQIMFADLVVGLRR